MGEPLKDVKLHFKWVPWHNVLKELVGCGFAEGSEWRAAAAPNNLAVRRVSRQSYSPP